VPLRDVVAEQRQVPKDLYDLAAIFR